MSDEVQVTDGVIFVLQDDGYFILRKGVVIFGECIVWGIYLIMQCFLTYRLTRRPHKNYKIPAPRKRVLILTLTMFTFSTIFLVLSIMRFVVSVNIVNMAPMVEGQTYQDRINNGIFADEVMNYMMSTIFSIQILLGDIIVLWRTYALYEDTPLALIFPCLLWLGGLVLDTVERTAFVLCWHFSRVQSSERWCGSQRGLNITGWSLTMGTNFVATSMIAYKAWKHRRVIKQSMGPNARRTLVEKILALLVESGFLYLAWWAAMSTSLIEFTTWGFGMQFQQHMWYMGNQLVGLYPALIVVLVDFQRSIWDEMYAGTSQMDSRFGYDSRLRFASTDSEAVGVNLQLTQLTTDIAASGSEDYNPSSFKKASLGGEESQPT